MDGPYHLKPMLNAAAKLVILRCLTTYIDYPLVHIQLEVLVLIY